MSGLLGNLPGTQASKEFLGLLGHLVPEYLKQPPLRDVPATPQKIPPNQIDYGMAGTFGAIDLASMLPGGAAKAAAPLVAVLPKGLSRATLGDALASRFATAKPTMDTGAGIQSYAASALKKFYGDHKRAATWLDQMGEAEAANLIRREVAGLKKPAGNADQFEFAGFPGSRPPTSDVPNVDVSPQVLDRVHPDYRTFAFRGTHSQNPRQFLAKQPNGMIGGYRQWFSTDDPELAAMYALRTNQHPNAHIYHYNMGDKELQHTAHHYPPSVQPLALKTRDYLRWDADGELWNSPHVQAAAFEEADKRRAPGVVIENVLDEPSTGGEVLKRPATVFATYDPSTVRSVFAQFKDLSSGNLLGGAAGAAVVTPEMLRAFRPPLFGMPQQQSQ